MNGKLRGIVDFLTHGIWDVEVSALRGMRRFGVRAARVLTLVARGFKGDECVLHASSLTFMTLLSIIPVLALALSLAKAVIDDGELRARAHDGLHEFFVTEVHSVSNDDDPAVVEAEASEPSVMENDVAEPAPDAPAEISPASGGIDEAWLQGLVDKAFDIVEGINFKALGGIGLLMLVWTVISLIGNIEASFNNVWGVKRPRTLVRKFTDYLSVLIILPFLSIAASSIPLVSKISALMGKLDGTGVSAMTGFPVFKALLTLLILTVCFSFLLTFLPNVKVKLVPGLIGGFTAALGFCVWMRICLSLQIGVAKYSAFFGSFAAVPILLFWVYVSWEIILAGAEVAYAVQNADSYMMENGWNKPSVRARLLLACEILRELSARMASGGGILNAVDFTTTRKISVRLVRETLHELEAGGVLVRVGEEEENYASRVDLRTYKLSELVQVFLNAGTSPDELGVTDLSSSALAAPALDAAISKAVYGFSA